MKKNAFPENNVTLSLTGRFVRQVLLALILGSMTLALGGCSILGLAAYKFTPPPRTSAKYVLPQEPTVVLIENFRDPAQHEIDAQQLTKAVLIDLKRFKTVPLVDDLAVQQLRDRDKAALAKMSIPAVGRAVGAKQVIYVDLIRNTIDMEAGRQMVKASLEVRVKVVDVATGASRWPNEVEQGWPLSMETPWVSIDNNTNEVMFLQRIQEDMGVQIGKLFRSYINENEDSEPQ